MKAILTNYRQSPRKVRLLADLVRGKKASEALTVLNLTAKKASEPFRKLISSAVANAGKQPEELTIKEVRVDKGAVFKRFKPAWRGMAHPIRHRTSHIKVVLDDNK